MRRARWARWLPLQRRGGPAGRREREVEGGGEDAGELGEKEQVAEADEA